MFEGRKLLIATKHQKEKVLAPILEKELQVNCFVDSKIDTDLFGTFSGEVERVNEPLTTARNKCLHAMDILECDLALASEGSFGNHPSAFFLPANDEILILIDKKNHLEFKVREISTQTNFATEEVSTEKELLEFAERIGFPSHAVILKKSKNELDEMVKGITDIQVLLDSFHYFMSKNTSVFIETDMRAMHNPSRLKVIEKACLKLVEQIKSLCPECNCPGFAITEIRKGLPCKSCHLPTNSTLAHIYLCQKCKHSQEKLFPNQIKFQDPEFCDFCNP